MKTVQGGAGECIRQSRNNINCPKWGDWAKAWISGSFLFLYVSCPLLKARWDRWDISEKNRVMGRSLASGDGDVDLFSAPSSLGARRIDVACLPCPTSQTRHKDQVKITRGCSNPLKAVTPRDFCLRAKRKQNCGEKLRKYHLYLNAKAHLSHPALFLAWPSIPVCLGFSQF